MKYVYPVILFKDEDEIGVAVPDLPGCFTCGRDMAEALVMAKDVIEMWLWDAENKNEVIPLASETLATKKGETLNFIVADTDEFRRAVDTKATKKTLSIPAWLNYQAEKANAPFSQILQQGLKEYLHLEC